MIANRSLTSAFFAYERAYRLRELTAHAQMASFSFDVFTGDMIRSLLAGAKLVLCPIEIVVDPPALYELMVREGIDMAEFVPATASLLFEWAERADQRLDFMRLVVVSSEAWRNERYGFFKGLVGPDTRLVNSYGLTEATIDSTWFEPDADTELIPGRFVPIGRALDNTRIYVLDANAGAPADRRRGRAVRRRRRRGPRLPQPPRADRRALRARSVRAVPARTAALAPLLYRTGDLARWLPDGTIDFLGRTDRQIKIRGFRIEPGEIESVLERHDTVRAAAVTDRQDEGGQSRLVAYLVAADPTHPPAPEDLRALVAEHLPAYMIPAAWVMVECSPVTPNGKVDLDALPEPTFDRSAAARRVRRRRAPRPSASCARSGATCSRWTRSASTTTSLPSAATRCSPCGCSPRSRAGLGVKIPLAALFQTATVAGLAELVDRQRGGEKDAGFNWIVPHDARAAMGPRSSSSVGSTANCSATRTWPPTGTVRPCTAWSRPAWTGARCRSPRSRRSPRTTSSRCASSSPRGRTTSAGSALPAWWPTRSLASCVAQGQEVGMAALIDSYWARRRPTRRQIEREKWSSFRAADARGKARWVGTRLVRLRNRIRTEISFRARVATVGADDDDRPRPQPQGAGTR